MLEVPPKYYQQLYDHFNRLITNPIPLTREQQYWNQLVSCVEEIQTILEEQSPNKPA